MPITDDQVATLRAYLAGNFVEHDRRYEQLRLDGARNGYMAMIEGACFEDVDRRFGKGTTSSEIVDFVAGLRAQSDRIREDLDPDAGERLIRAALGHGSVDDFDGKTRFNTEILLLAGLISDAALDDAGLDEFLAEARKLADEWTA